MGIVAIAAVAWAVHRVVAALLGVLMRLVWAVDALPQVVVWGAVVVLLGWLTLRLGKRRKRAGAAVYAAPEPTRSDLAELADVIRRSSASSHARAVLRRRLGRTAVALRVRREPIILHQAWEDLDEGRWPRHADLQQVLSREHVGWGWKMRVGYVQHLSRAVEALWRYAQGGSLDDH